MDPDSITDTQIHGMETLRYSWERVYWTWTLTPSQTPRSMRWKHSGTAGETMLNMDPDTITDTQIHEVETLRYSWGRVYWTWTLTPSQTPRSTRGKHSGTAGGGSTGHGP